MASVDKVWAPLGGDPVLWHSLRRLASHADRTVVVVRADMMERARDALLPTFPDLVLVPGGAERRDSVLNGVSALDGCPAVAIHDAARPFASAQLLQAGLAQLGAARGAIPVLPITDTVKRVDNGTIVDTLDRSSLRLAQTPQVFDTASLIAAHRSTAGRPLTDDAAALEAAGETVAVFPGELWNLKITTPDDLALAEMLLDRRLTV
jgi:2-C-methyl-D-erythritol 4-phosphate cytidylyltransferase/2-C-methyl-D-erythritol 2,4-cyclodiphosphate synthase